MVKRLLTLLVVSSVLDTSVGGQELHLHPAQDQSVHDQFYSDWQRLDTGTSCCNKQDCFPTQFKVDKAGNWYALRRDGWQDTGLASNWVRVPDHLLEHNAMSATYARHPRGSPDGRNHVCIANDFAGSVPTVLCAVVGAGQ